MFGWVEENLWYVETEHVGILGVWLGEFSKWSFFLPMDGWDALGVML